MQPAETGAAGHSSVGMARLRRFVIPGGGALKTFTNHCGEY